MKTVLKIAVALLVLLVVAAGVALFFLGSPVNRAVKEIIERGGTYALGVETTVDTADVGLRDGTLALDAVTVANPPAPAGASYPSPLFITLDRGEVRVEPSTIREDTVVVPEVVLSGINVNLERAGGVTNYKQILENLERFEGTEQPAEPAPDAPTGPNVIVNRLTLRDITVNARFRPNAGEGGVGGAIGSAVGGAVGELANVTVNVPEITLEDVGTEEPITVAELTGVIVKALLEASVNAAGEQLPGDFRETLRAQLDQLRPLADLGIDGLDDLGGLGEGVRDRVREGIGGLLGGRREGGEGAAGAGEQPAPEGQ